MSKSESGYSSWEQDAYRLTPPLVVVFAPVLAAIHRIFHKWVFQKCINVWALIWVFHEALVYKVGKIIGPSSLRNSWRSITEHCLNMESACFHERWVASCKLICKATKWVDIDFPCVLTTIEYFRSHKKMSTSLCFAPFIIFLTKGAWKSKVTDFNRAIFVNENIFAFYISMKHFFAMHILKTFCHTIEAVLAKVFRVYLTSSDDVIDGAIFHQLKNDKYATFPVKDFFTVHYVIRVERLYQTTLINDSLAIGDCLLVCTLHSKAAIVTKSSYLMDTPLSSFSNPSFCLIVCSRVFPPNSICLCAK